MPTTTEWGYCTAQYSNGAFCNLPSLPNAPFPICVKHAAQVLEFLGGHIPTLEQSGFDPREPWAFENPDTETSVVYYLRVGKHIKIGTTKNLASRMQAYPPDSELLAVEPGSYDIERRRHDQFWRDRGPGREWFHPSEALMAHIETLAS